MWDLIKQWVICLLLAGSLFALLKLLPKHKRIIFIAYSFVPIIFVTARLISRWINVYTLGWDFSYVLQSVPLTLCGLASITLPIIAFKKTKVLVNLLYFINMPGAVFAVLLDNTGAGKLDFNALAFVIPHMLYIIMPLMMMGFKYIKPEIKMVVKTMLFFALLINVLHVVNSVLTVAFPTDLGYPGPTTNYLYTMFPGDSSGPNPTNGLGPYEYKKFNLLKQAWDILPVPLVYLYLLLPVLLAVAGLLSLALVTKEGYKNFYIKFKNKETYKSFFVKVKLVFIKKDKISVEKSENTDNNLS